MISDEHREQLIKILQQNARVFHEEPGRISTYEHKFRVTDESTFFQRSYPIPLAYQDKVYLDIKRMISHGIIEWSSRQYINPIVTVTKKNGSVRLSLDARKLNSVTIPDYEGTVPINEMLAHCSGINMSSIDMKNSFWQILLHRKSRDFTGFIYKGKTYRFTVTPLGLKTSSASLSRGLNSILSEEVKHVTLIYIDDCLVISKSVEDHLQHLKLSFENKGEASEGGG